MDQKTTPNRSLFKDKFDLTALHSPSWRIEDISNKRHFGETSPFFYTRLGQPLALEGLYRGAHAFLIANGPSLRELDTSHLASRWSMTLNNGPRTLRGNANCTVDDPARFSLSIWLDPTLMKFCPISHFDRPLWDNRRLPENSAWTDKWEPSQLKVGDCPNVIGYRRNEKFHAPRWLTEETINWGNHKNWGGGRSVLLASLRILYVLGFRTVFLLGVDLEMSEEKRYHFSEARSTSAIKGNMETYTKLQNWFSELQPHFLKAGFHVFNCNPKSKLTAFPFCSYQEALSLRHHTLGLTDQERTEGMYRDLKDKSAEVEAKSTTLPAS